MLSCTTARHPGSLFPSPPAGGQCEGALGCLTALQLLTAVDGCPKWAGVTQAVTFPEGCEAEAATGRQQQ